MSGEFNPGFCAALLAAMLALSACEPGPPMPALYVLGDPAPDNSAFVSQINASVVEIKPVRLPDYLDTTDIITRGGGGRVVAIRNARWAERLSVGMTRAIGTSLGARLPQFVISTSPPLDVPRWQVLIDVETFERQPGGLCVLTGRWSIWDGTGERKLKADRFSITTQGNAEGDAALVATMNREVDQLAGEVVTAFRDTRFAAGS